MIAYNVKYEFLEEYRDRLPLCNNYSLCVEPFIHYVFAIRSVTRKNAINNVSGSFEIKSISELCDLTRVVNTRNLIQKHKQYVVNLVADGKVK